VVAIEEYQECTSRRRHTKQPRIRESVVVQFPRPILPPDTIALELRLPIQNAQIQITARFVDSRIHKIRIENTMDDEVRESEKETGHMVWVFFKFCIAPEKRIEDEFRIRKGSGGCHVGRGHCTCVGGTSLAEGGVEGIIVGTSVTSVRVLDPYRRRRGRNMRRGRGVLRGRDGGWGPWKS
jgi:hypothetical protein